MQGCIKQETRPNTDNGPPGGVEGQGINCGGSAWELAVPVWYASCDTSYKVTTQLPRVNGPTLARLQVHAHNVIGNVALPVPSAACLDLRTTSHLPRTFSPTPTLWHPKPCTPPSSPHSRAPTLLPASPPCRTHLCAHTSNRAQSHEVLVCVGRCTAPNCTSYVAAGASRSSGNSTLSARRASCHTTSVWNSILQGQWGSANA